MDNQIAVMRKIMSSRKLDHFEMLQLERYLDSQIKRKESVNETLQFSSST